jgi:hypothetical protein
LLSEANVWSRFEFQQLFIQQLYQSSPLLSPNCFSLKQIPVLNLNCKDSLGFPSYILHKKTFFSAWFAFSSVVHLIFCCPSGLLCIFSKCLHHFSFRCQSGLFSMTKKGLRHCSFLLPLWAFPGPQGVNWNFGWRALGPDWEFSGIPPAWVLLGVPLFSGTLGTP